MDSTSGEVVYDFSALIGIKAVCKVLNVERLSGCEVVRPSFDPKTNVDSKDIVVSQDGGDDDCEDDVVVSKDKYVAARIYVPKKNHAYPVKKLPLLIYFHGGGFVIETPASPIYHNFLNTIVSEANVIGLSVHYRRAPEYPVPVAFDDSWAVLEWVVSHFNGNGTDEWLNRYADFENVFFGGDSAGATIAHEMGLRVGRNGLPSMENNIKGIILVHPYFLGVEQTESEKKDPLHSHLAGRLFCFASPAATGLDDPWINPAKVTDLKKLGCKRVLVFVAGNDFLRDRGWSYKELLEKSGWHADGDVEVMESIGEGHVFHLFDPNSEKALELLGKFAAFMNVTPI